ncbi:MAG TPA: M24 family metallopeptidase [Phycisphaerales bacterium]|jgi:methionyl aminopeptidase|nr:M24 family metallopeptidase [Phycisphaerales bacterium]
MARPPLITPAEADLAYAAAQCVVETHRRVAAFLKIGQTLAVIDQFIARTLEDLHCKSCFLGYSIPGQAKFPSHACLSVNACVVHGTAASHLAPMQQGDLLKIDIGVSHRGWIGDAGWTYCFGTPTPLQRRLMDCGKESLRRGVQQLRPDKMYIHWAQAVQGHVENECGFHCVRGLGGHGIGRYEGPTKRGLHLPPFVSNVVPVGPGEWPDATARCLPGTLVAVEPMIAVGTGETVQRPRQWPVFSADNSLTVHYEHDVLITERGPRVLTEGMDSLPDVIG